jgi:hypothetical protein
MTPKQVEAARRLEKAALRAQQRSKAKAFWASAEAAGSKRGKVSDPCPVADPCRLTRAPIERKFLKYAVAGGSLQYALDLLAPEPRRPSRRPSRRRPRFAPWGPGTRTTSRSRWRRGR